MTIALETLQEYVGSEGEYSSLLTDCLAEAEALVNKYVGEAPVPEAILDRATLEVAADLFNRRNAPNGIVSQQYATVDGMAMGAVRIARDPMAAAYKLLQRWVLPW